MKDERTISIIVPPGIELNGMGQMLQQYLSQNIEEFPFKKKQALELCCCISVEVEGGIASTVHFQNQIISISNGVDDDPDLYMQGSYRSLAKVLSGQENPLGAVFKNHIQIKKIPKKPIQALKTFQFLKIPPALQYQTKKKSWDKTVKWVFLISIVLVGLLYVIFR